MEFSVPMALVDLLPVAFFGIAAVILMRDLYHRMSKGAFAVFSAGMLNVTLAGLLKALYKLLHAAGACDFRALSDMFFPVQSIGFLLAGVGLLSMVTHRRAEKNAALAVAPPVFKGTFLFVGAMVLGLGMIDTVLCILSAKIRKPWLIAVFVFSFVCSLCMGYLSSKDFAEAAMNWIAEGVNVAGQGSLLAGVLILHRSGLPTAEG